MNPRWEVFRTGGAMIARTIYLRGGRRVVVVDRAKMARGAVRQLAKAGHSPRDISIAMRLPLTVVWALLD